MERNCQAVARNVKITPGLWLSWLLLSHAEDMAGKYISFYLWLALFVSSSPSSMSSFFVLSLLFGLIFGQTASLCALSEYTIHVEKRECAYCLAINTTICAGFCMTRVRGTDVSVTATPANQGSLLIENSVQMSKL